MNATGVRFALFATGLLGFVALARFAARPLVPVALADPSGNTTAVDRRAAVTEPSQDSVSAIVSRDPFRISRRPVIPAYDPLRLAEQQAPPPPRPSLVLVGIVSGEMPLAVVEGLPGVDGSRVMRIGDQVAGLKLRQIGHNRAVIVGMDTTWVLEVREPWKN
jgi:hypothetical protein